MEDLLAIQIRDSCKLAVPNGLKELMSDISREVLRAQPTNVYSFIANYLSALLVTREHMTMASHICNCVAEKELEEMLSNLGLTDDVAEPIKTITQYFDEPKVKEGDILSKLTESAENIDEEQLISIQNAIRMLYRRHKNRSEDISTRLASISTPDEIQDAVNHTLNLYQQCKPTEEQYHQMAVKIQAAYRAYGVRREKVQSLKSLQNESDTSFLGSESSTESEDEIIYKVHQMSSIHSDFSFLAYKLKLADHEISHSIDGELDEISNFPSMDQTRRCTVKFGHFPNFKQHVTEDPKISKSMLSENVQEEFSIDNQVDSSSMDSQKKQIIINSKLDCDTAEVDSIQISI